MASIAQHLKVKHIRFNSNVYSCLTFAFTSLINMTRDVEPLVAQKCTSHIETLSESALKSMMMCFELQFDSNIADRIAILQILMSLHSTLYNTKTSGILSWEFFLHCFSTLSIEAQLSFNDSANECVTPIDSSLANNSSSFQHQIKIAKFALLQTKFIRSISKQSETQQGDPNPNETVETNNDESILIFLSGVLEQKLLNKFY